MRKEIKKGDIFWYNFGQGKGSEQGGIRPVIIVSNNVGNKFSPTVIVAVITTQIKGNLPTHVQINEWKQIGLKQPCRILTEQTRTVDKKFLGDYVGRINDIPTMQKLNKALAINVGIIETKSRRDEEISKREKNIKNKRVILKSMEDMECTSDKYYRKLKQMIEREEKELLKIKGIA